MRSARSLVFLESSKYSDVTIRIQGEDIPAHKIVLAKGSEYFEKLFSGQWSVCQSASR